MPDSSGYPGLDQINVVVPDPVGCNVSVTAVVGNVPSNFPTAPLSESGGECSDPLYGIRGSDLSRLSGQANVNSAAVFVARTVSTNASGTQMTASATTADVRHYPGTYGASGGLPSIGSCVVTEALSAPTSTGLVAQGQVSKPRTSASDALSRCYTPQP
jgi:hypothetical protein